MTIKNLIEELKKFDYNKEVALFIHNILTSSGTEYFHTFGHAFKDMYISEYEGRVTISASEE